MPLEYLTESEAWGPRLHDLTAVACWNLGLFREAVHHGTEALNLDPGDQRLAGNLAMYVTSEREDT